MESSSDTVEAAEVCHCPSHDANLYFASAPQRHHCTHPTVRCRSCLSTELNAMIALHLSMVELAGQGSSTVLDSRLEDPCVSTAQTQAQLKALFVCMACSGVMAVCRSCQPELMKSRQSHRQAVAALQAPLRIPQLLNAHQTLHTLTPRHRRASTMCGR